MAIGDEASPELASDASNVVIDDALMRSNVAWPLRKVGMTVLVWSREPDADQTSRHAKSDFTRYSGLPSTHRPVGSGSIGGGSEAFDS